MSSRTVLTVRLVVLLVLAALARGFPAGQEDDESSSGPLPLLQFTKGGIRVNFGGYHAQAGLGGFLTGSSKDGGLFASAGTPQGAHAQAGLGGSLNGGPAGGLQARAGLGNGGPEAEAGLGGSLAGSEPQGGLYAGSSAGNFAAADRINWIERSDTIGKNVQVIARPKKATELGNAGTSDSSNPAGIKVSSSSSSASSDAAANAGASVADEDDSAERSQHPARWYFRKRLRERAGIAVTKSSHDPIASPPEQAEAAPATTREPTTQTPTVKQPRPSFGIFTRGATSDSSASAGNHGGHKPKSSTFFDDIFNIPISALNAVNQLLKNHVGK